MQYLHDNQINGYIPDNQFRSRDPKFANQKEKYGKRHQNKKKRSKPTQFIPASEFRFDPVAMACICPAGNTLNYQGSRKDDIGNLKAFFGGKLLQCRHCDKNRNCMKNPSSADHHKSHGRQVSFIIEKDKSPTYNDWMKHRVDSPEGKFIYSHRMSVVEPVFGNIGTNNGLNRFRLRGKAKVQRRWRLYCMVHNIEKIMNYGKIAA